MENLKKEELIEIVKKMFFENKLSIESKFKLMWIKHLDDVYFDGKKANRMTKKQLIELIKDN